MFLGVILLVFEQIVRQAMTNMINLNHLHPFLMHDSGSRIF